MRSYRVTEPATVFDSQGRLYGMLPPGSVVVPGSIQQEGSPAYRYLGRARRRWPGRYDDKQLRPSRDYPTKAAGSG